jgi:branched-chain amino acid transport system permease protein
MQFLPFIISGLGIGAVYALSGVGLVILYRASGVLNFAFGGIGAFAAFVSWQLMEWDVPLALCIAAAIIVAAAISFGYGRFLAPLLAFRDATSRAAGTLALALVLIAAIGLIWGELPKRLQLPTDKIFVTVFEVRLNMTRIIAVGVAIAFVGGITALLSFTRLGLNMRALANDRDLSGILGVPLLRTEAMAWLITGVFAGCCGLLLADFVRLQGTFLTFLVVPAVAAAILGQLRSLWMTAVGGFAIGLVEALLTPIEVLAPYRAAAPFVIALAVVTILGASSKANLSDR